MKNLFLILTIFLMGGCAPQYIETIKQEQKTDFGAGIDVTVSYHKQAAGGIVVADLYNHQKKQLAAWFIHLQETDGQKVSRSIRYYQGADQKKREVFQVPILESGLIEVFQLEVFDEAGSLLIKSDPIRNTSEP